MVYTFNFLSSAVLTLYSLFPSLTGIEPSLRNTTEVPTCYMKFCFPSCTAPEDLYLELGLVKHYRDATAASKRRLQ